MNRPTCKVCGQTCSPARKNDDGTFWQQDCYHLACRPCKICGQGLRADSCGVGEDFYHYDCRPCKVCGQGLRADGCSAGKDLYHYDCRLCKVCGLAKLANGCIVGIDFYHYNCHPARSRRYWGKS